MADIPIDQMYCAEQICIPPSFPYLLRQYAKAAIRTQPTDLLTWSTAYFRCLSFNIPPPVKTRLEYPLPRNYHGITPGWLKTLTNQLQGNFFLRFKVLWDRWMGACLEHNTLIKILCLGQFDQVESVPWIKVMAICVGCLTEDLTQTMILICEILSEEPEGGSAMIPLETFITLYVFLAKIDASKDQILKNYHFRDSLLDLYREKEAKQEESEQAVEEVVEPSQLSESAKSESTTTVETAKTDLSQKISCPSLPEDDDYSLKYLLKDDASIAEHEEEEEGGEAEVAAEILKKLDDVKQGEEGEQMQQQDLAKVDTTKSKDIGDQGSKAVVDEENVRAENVSEKSDQVKNMAEKIKESKSANDEQTEETNDDAKLQEITEASQEESKTTDEKIEEREDESKLQENEVNKKESKTGDEMTKDKENETKLQTINGTDIGEAKVIVEAVSELAEKSVSELISDQDKPLEDNSALDEDLARLNLLQKEMAGEDDDELEKYKAQLTADMPLNWKEIDQSTSTDETSKIIFPNDADDEADLESVVIEAKDDKYLFDDVLVEAIPGIGGIVPDEVIDAVQKYMKECAKNQHGMVMPRNLRHFSCPPLELIDYEMN